MTMQAFEELMAIRGLGLPREKRTISGRDPVLPTRFRLGETSADVQMAIGVAVNDLWEMRTGNRQELAIQVDHAAAILRSYLYLSLPESDMAADFQLQLSRQAISTPHPTRDGRYFLPHMGLPHLATRVLNILNCEYELESVRRALMNWDAMALEDAVAAANGCGAMIRTWEEWQNHEQGRLLESRPVVEIVKIADSEPEPFPDVIPDRPLQGLRVLDLTRILAGPTCARTLAEHGADVLMVTAPALPQAAMFVADTSHGKRTCYLDFTIPEQKKRLLDLIATTDVFSQGYRPGAMDKQGLSPEALAEQRPGIIYTSMNCYGYEGPFSDRAGWEQLAQCVTGIAAEQGGDEAPHLLPAAACDYTTGYLAAFGTLVALGLRARVGGSYHVKASLCQSGMFIQRQGRVDLAGEEAEISAASIEKIMSTSKSNQGVMQHLGPVLRMSETMPRWDLPSQPLGTHEPVWLP